MRTCSAEHFVLRPFRGYAITSFHSYRVIALKAVRNKNKLFEDFGNRTDVESRSPRWWIRGEQLMGCVKKLSAAISRPDK